MDANEQMRLMEFRSEARLDPSTVKATIPDIAAKPYLNHATKRALDIVVSGLALLVLSPVLLLIAVAIRLESEGNVIYKQKRIGSKRVSHKGKTVWQVAAFDMYKFRSMRASNNNSLHKAYTKAYIEGDQEKMQALQPEAETAKSFKLNRDPRITRVGQIIRELSIDELPQLWNIFTGTMSLVGPRPALDYEVELYEQEDLQRLACKPGLTGWWQVNGRTTTSFKEMIALDLDYIQQQSVLFDLKIILLTIPVVFSKEGAG